MGLFSRFLRRPTPPAAILMEGIERLQAGITMNLLMHYKSLDQSEALLLANCAMSYAIHMEPLGAEAQEYQSRHSELIRQHAMELAGVAGVAQALSYLYAAITVHIAIRTKNPFSEEAGRLAARAAELSLYIPNTYDICGSGDAIQCIHAITDFADDYLRRAQGR